MRLAARQTVLPGVGAEARRLLLERLLGERDVGVCLTRGLQWLAAHGRVRQALGLMLSEDGERLIGAASLGLGRVAAQRFSLRLRRPHPLARVFTQGRIASFSRGLRVAGCAIPGPLLAVPLGEPRCGLLLVRAVGSPVADSIEWLAGVLGRKLVELRGTGLRQRPLRLVHPREAEGSPLARILDAIADPLVVSDLSGRVVSMNPAAERLFVAAGARPEVKDRARRNDAHFSSFLARVRRSPSECQWRSDLHLVDPADGTPLPAHAIANRTRAEGQDDGLVVTLLHDRREALEKARLYEETRQASAELTAKVQEATRELAAQNELLRRQAIQLEQASAAKTQFLANMSHEVRTPLNAILGYTQMLLQGVSGELTPAQRRSLMRVDSNSRHLLGVINEILDIARIEAGRMPLHVSRFDVADVVREVMAELQAMIERSPLQVELEISDQVPEIISDRQKVKQIMVNLLSNALKFTHQGSIRIRASYAKRRKMIAIAVRDTGIGIAPEDRQRVFEDFNQVDSSTTRAYGGTGLGLSICRRLATMLGGRISLESELGKGSTFTLWIPRRAKR